jgi:hypothetical protein
MDESDTLAFGVIVEFRSSENGGRLTPLLGGHAVDDRFTFRPNWGLPAMIPPEQTGAVVFGFDRSPINPGDTARAVIVVPYPEMVSQWTDQVTVGTRLPVYEGSRVFAEAIVEERWPVRMPLSEADASRLDAWLDQAH